MSEEAEFQSWIQTGIVRGWISFSSFCSAHPQDQEDRECEMCNAGQWYVDPPAGVELTPVWD